MTATDFLVRRHGPGTPAAVRWADGRRDALIRLVAGVCAAGQESVGTSSLLLGGAGNNARNAA